MPHLTDYIPVLLSRAMDAGEDEDVSYRKLAGECNNAANTAVQKYYDLRRQREREAATLRKALKEERKEIDGKVCALLVDTGFLDQAR